MFYYPAESGLFLSYLQNTLRTRELLADAQAATVAGDRHLLETLTGRKEIAPPKFCERLYELLSAHPLVAKRVNGVTRPEGGFEWTLLAVLTFLCARQGYAVIWPGWQFPQVRCASYYAMRFAS